MKLGFDLNLAQTQKLVMTPELRQAIQILQFNNQELSEYIENQMETNPVLEIDTERKNEESVTDVKDKDETIDWKEYFDQYDGSNYKKIRKIDESKQTFESFTSSKTNLKDYLLFQLNLSEYDVKKKRIGKLIIEYINQNGYFISTIEEVSRQLGVTFEEVEEILKLIQSFEPLGVGARNLQECLLIQLESKKNENKLVYLMVNNHLEDIAQNRILKIAKELDISKERVQKKCDLIKTLEPKPGRSFTHENDNIKYIVPDITLKYIDGEYIVDVNDVATPRLIISKYYKNLLSNSKDKDTSKYLTNKLNSCVWLIKSIEQRRMTIYRVVESIVEFQKDFFEKGNKSLKPLILKDVAEDISVHESTVSRAVNGKYIQTPRGTFELKFFFSGGVASQNGGISSTSIKMLIKELINNEDVKKPMSDQKIANNLKNRQIEISRRTVAKYRDELNIASSSMRKRY